MTNAVLNLLVLVALAVACGPRLRRLRAGPLIGAALFMLAMTLVFDTVMVTMGLTAYAPDRILGWRVWRAPVEDFAYPIAAVLALPVLWAALGDRRRRPGDREPDAAAPASAPDTEP